MSDQPQWPDPPDKSEFKAGAIYQDCFYHPCLCFGANIEVDEIWGVSLVDGTCPRCESLIYSGTRTVTLDEAWWMKMLIHREPLYQSRYMPVRWAPIPAVDPDAGRAGGGPVPRNCIAPGFAPGDLYADDLGHPCVCINVDPADGAVWGISLVDGSYPRSCSLDAARGRKLDAAAAWERKRTIQKLPPE